VFTDFAPGFESFISPSLGAPLFLFMLFAVALDVRPSSSLPNSVGPVFFGDFLLRLTKSYPPSGGGIKLAAPGANTVNSTNEKRDKS
jgi:hypothetical protein